MTGAGTAGNVITGIYNSGWTWDALASNMQYYETDNSTLSITLKRTPAYVFIRDKNSLTAQSMFVVNKNSGYTVSQIGTPNFNISVSNNTFTIGESGSYYVGVIY